MPRNTLSPPRTASTVWLTGLPSAGKTTIARALVGRLAAEGRPAQLLDGDELRTALCADLGFSREDRVENVRRIGVVAELLSRNGVTAVCAVISPYREARDEVRARHGERFLEVWVATPVHVCAERDVKGLYARQRAGEIRGLTGVDDPYEPPLCPEVRLEAHEVSVEEAVEQLWQHLES
ncbi:MAG: adenylyl-sulfate kinase [Acidimicrobiia bacterium]|nr:adenylyl-sulfate kinase [Acidimicrobiia bacterium]